MSGLRMGTAEAKFADIIWQNEPIPSGELAKLGNANFGWKKTTSFTVLKRLCERGLFKNERGIVTSLVSRDEYYAQQSQQYVEETFGGSLPAFVAAFTRRQSISAEDLDEIQHMIDRIRKGGQQ